AVDSSLHHIGAGHHAGKRVGDRELAVVVRVDADACAAAGVGERRSHGLDTVSDRIGLAPTVGVAEHDPRRAGSCRAQTDLDRVKEPRDALLVRGGKGDGRTLRTVAQSRVIDDYWLPSGHKKTSRPLGWEVNRHQRRALSRGTSPANLDGDAALSAHAVSKARASARCRAWLRPPN